MRTHVVINGINMTPYVVDGSYKIGTDDEYESWKDGNKVEHRIIVSSKVTGSFDIVCSNKSNSITLADFLAALNAATDNGVLTMGIYVPTTNSFEAINCYYTKENTEHIITGEGNIIDVITITIKER